MADRFTPEQRHQCMSHVKSKNTKPEVLVRKALFQHGFRYRINVRGLSGHPDIVLRKYKTVIFINGCFWHGHENCKKASIPQTNIEFWTKKISDNRSRDRANIDSLHKDGWHVIVIWECELVKNKINDMVDRLISEIEANSR